jgi:hypothetical protein
MPGETLSWAIVACMWRSEIDINQLPIYVVNALKRRSLAHYICNQFRKPAKRLLVSNPSKAIGNSSSRRLNTIAGFLVNPQYYLEIGVENGYTFEAVRMPYRTAVDPCPRFAITKLPELASVYATTSDNFFANICDNRRFDLFFIDGLHTYEQTYRDIINCLQRSYPWSVILLDDVVPSDAASALRDIEQSRAERKRLHSKDGRWQGDVFRTMLIMHDHHPELYVRTILDHSSKEQAIIWKKPDSGNIRPLSDELLTTYMEQSFQEVFHNGIPDLFHIGSEYEIMEDTARHLAAIQENRGISI